MRSPALAAGVHATKWPAHNRYWEKPKTRRSLKEITRRPYFWIFVPRNPGRGLQPSSCSSIAWLRSGTPSPDQLSARLPQPFREFLRVDPVGLHHGFDNGVLGERWFAMTPIHRWTPHDRPGGEGQPLERHYAAIRIGSRSPSNGSIRCGWDAGTSTVSSLRTRNHSAYSAGTTSSVSAVATNRPPMMVIAMGPQKMLPASGIIPRMAASAVRITGR